MLFICAQRILSASRLWMVIQAQSARSLNWLSATCSAPSKRGRCAAHAPNALRLLEPAFSCPARFDYTLYIDFLSLPPLGRKPPQVSEKTSSTFTSVAGMSNSHHSVVELCTGNMKRQDAPTRHLCKANCSKFRSVSGTAAQH